MNEREVFGRFFQAPGLNTISKAVQQFFLKHVCLVGSNPGLIMRFVAVSFKTSLNAVVTLNACLNHMLYRVIQVHTKEMRWIHAIIVVASTKYVSAFYEMHFEEF